MSNFVMIENPHDFDIIKKYVKDNLNTKFYFSPKLMYEIIDGFNVKCVIGLNSDDIKIKSIPKIDIICTPVYSRFFQKDVFRVDAIKLSDTISQFPNPSIHDEAVIFGLDGEYHDYSTSYLEVL